MNGGIGKADKKKERDREQRKSRQCEIGSEIGRRQEVAGQYGRLRSDKGPDKPAGKKLAAKFEVSDPVVVLAWMMDGQVEQKKRLDRVWALVGNEEAFAKYVRDEINTMLEAMAEVAADETNGDAAGIPIPAGGADDAAAPDTADRIPIPE